MGLLALVVSYFSMTFWVANIAETEIKKILSESQSAEFSVELIRYDRNFFTATVITEINFLKDKKSIIPLKITTIINHYPHQAVLNNYIEITDQVMAKKTESYFGTAQWITSTETINLFSQLTGKLRIVAGQYENESEAITSEAFALDYKIDLKDNHANFNVDWPGLNAITYGTIIKLDSLQFNSYMGELSSQNDYDYQLKIKTIEVEQNDSLSLIEGVILKGNSQQGATPQTFDTTNELMISTYQLKNEAVQTFTDSHLKLTVTGLYQPAFELLDTQSNDNQQAISALVELVNHGARLRLSQLNSQTPWGEVDGTLDLVLDKGSPLMEIIANPYILFDYMSGNANLVLPLSLLNEPLVEKQLRMGLMSGFLEKKEQTLNLQTSFQLGELTVNGQVIPL